MAIFNRRSFMSNSLRCAGAGALGLAMPAVVRAAGPIELKLAHGDSPRHPAQQVALQFAKLVEERTGGEVHIRVFAGGQLGTELNSISGLSTGIIDFAMQSSGFLAQFFPRIQVFDLPFLFKDSAVANQVLDGDAGAQIFKDMPAKGVYGLCWGHNGWRVVETRDNAVNEPKDLNGLKIRLQPSAIFASMFKALGAIPVTLDVTEVYLALSQNTVQAVEVPFLVVAASKLYEVIKHVGLTNHVYGAAALLASKGKLDSLSPKAQSVIRDTAKEMSPQWRTLLAQRSDEDRQTCEQKGVVVNAVNHDAFRQAMSPVYTEFRDKIGADIVDQVLKATSA